MLIPYNPATKATPPKADDHDPNYFQSAEIARIWEALENEPIKWKTMVHLFLVTGCRRGEVLGLKWSKVDWENKQIYIDCNLLYRKELGIYEDTPKTKGSVRYIRLPDQTMELLAEYRKWYREEKFRWGDKWEDNDYLFPRERSAHVPRIRLQLVDRVQQTSRSAPYQPARIPAYASQLVIL